MSSKIVQTSGSPYLRTQPQQPIEKGEFFFFPSIAEKGVESLSLKARVQEIPRDCEAFFKDEAWMTLVVDCFGIASRSLELVGTGAASVVPCLSIVSSPFYLYHAFKNSKERFKMMVAAVKTSRVADAIFWFGRAVDATGSAISTITKPFAGGFQLSGATSHHVVLGALFSVVIPIILIVFGTIGLLAKGWSFLRTKKALDEFNQMVERKDFREVLQSFKGVDLSELGVDEALLEESAFNENHFTNSERREALQARIETFFEKVHVGRDEELLHEAGEIISIVRSEMHRKLFYNALFLLMAITTIAAGILLLNGAYRLPGSIVALSSSALTLLYVAVEKGISQERFYKLDRALHQKLSRKHFNGGKKQVYLISE